MSYEAIKRQDPEVYAAMMRELGRQRDHIEHINVAVVPDLGFALGHPRLDHGGIVMFRHFASSIAALRLLSCFPCACTRSSL